MFTEFDSNTLKEWNNLSKEQKLHAVSKGEVQIVANIDIKIERNQQISEEHKYYQVIEKASLIDDILVSKISDQKTILSINTYKGNNEPELISIKTNEEKRIKIDRGIFSIIYIIRVSDIKYGQVFEL